MKPTRPQDILPDGVDETILQGVKIRKGSAAAAFVNAGVVASPTATLAEKAAALALIEEVAPGLVAGGMYDHVVWKNPEIQAIMERAAKKLQRTPPQ